MKTTRVSLLLAGIAALAAVHGWRWRAERALALRIRTTAALLPRLATPPAVSVLVAAWNEGAQIDDLLRSFATLRYPIVELILCAGGSDDTLARAHQLAGPRVQVIEQHPGEGKQAALARCYALATGELIYLTDADCLLDDEALLHLVNQIVNQGVAAATGTCRPLAAQAARLLPSYLWAIDQAVSMRRPTLSSGLHGRNCLVSRAAIERSGGLEFSAPSGTDYQLARRLLRAGLTIHFVAPSVVSTRYPEYLGDYRRRQGRWLRNLLVYGPRYGAWADVRATAITLVSGAGMLALPPLALLLPRLARLPQRGLAALLLSGWLLAFVHAVLARLRYLGIAALLRQQPIAARVVLALPGLTLHDFLTWALPMIDLMTARRRAQW